MFCRQGCESCVSSDFFFNEFLILFFPSGKLNLLQGASGRSRTYKACSAKSVGLLSFSYPVPQLCSYTWQNLKTGWASVGNEMGSNKLKELPLR